MRTPLSLAALLAASLSQAQYLISELSFGHAGRISPPEARGQIPNFALSGSPEKPEVLSNRIILTPLAPGNQRGAIWSTQTLVKPQWIADVDFRANGPDRGGGNLNIWLVGSGPRDVGSSSIYSVGKFDGLAIVIDSAGGSGGMVRGFLNDGTKDFASHHNVDELAFGHCSYSYRNLGRPSQVKLRQTGNAFRVEIDGHLCFETDKLSIPSGYQFGVTAATPDTPDSFEVFKMVVMSDNTDYSHTGHETPPQQQQQQSHDKNPPSRGPRNPAVADANDAFGELPDENADIFKTSKAQFMDLHNRMQNTNHQLSAMHRTVSRHQQQSEKHQEELGKLLGDIRSELRRLDELAGMQKRMETLESELRSIHQELARKIQANERSVKGILDDHHSTLAETVLASAPGHGLLIFVIVGTQVVLVAGYIVYKRRRASMPKKYL